MRLPQRAKTFLTGVAAVLLLASTTFAEPAFAEQAGFRYGKFQNELFFNFGHGKGFHQFKNRQFFGHKGFGQRKFSRNFGHSRKGVFKKHRGFGFNRNRSFSRSRSFNRNRSFGRQSFRRN